MIHRVVVKGPLRVSHVLRMAPLCVNSSVTKYVYHIQTSMSCAYETPIGYIEMKLVLKVREVKRLMELKAHQNGVKLANSLEW